VIVHNFYFKSISVPPNETCTILVVHSNTVLSGAASSKDLEPITRWHLQVVQLHGGIQYCEFLERSSLQISWKASMPARQPQPFSFLISETRYHNVR
jgi:hypothetical protein